MWQKHLVYKPKSRKLARGKASSSSVKTNLSMAICNKNNFITIAIHRRIFTDGHKT